MDKDWSLQVLHDFVGATELVLPPARGERILGFDYRRTSLPEAEVVAMAQLVEQIFDRVLPKWRDILPVSKTHRWKGHREIALRCIAQLAMSEELADRLGDREPSLDAATLHPWIWEGARSLWQSGHFREAVGAAARRLNSETQAKLGRRQISETDLFNQAFNKDPASTGNPRLRLTTDDGSKTGESIRRGVRAFAEGCFAAMRNPVSHDVGDLPENEALEQLAAFSVLARWVDASTLDTVHE